MNRKKRILIVNEFSQLSTGFSNYMKELIPRLHKTGKYEITELGVYVDKYHPEIDSVEWRVIPNQPDPNNQVENRIYNSNKLNQFGMWKFDEALLETQADIVITISDPWMSSFITRSPLRRHFKFIHMPTCDGQPQKREWLEFYKQADILLTYSHWAKNIIETETGGQAKVTDVAGAGPDPKTFKPIENKDKLRETVQIPKDAFIIGTVMRNQPRKLFQELFSAFSRFLEICKENGRDDIAKKTFLYCHTSYPDLGWDLPEELRRYNISHKVIFTYFCQACQSVYPSHYQNDVTICKNCQNMSAIFPNTLRGVDKDTLNKIYGMFDLYIQYSICEGLGIPSIEAKAAGIPIMGIEQSATAELVNGGGGIPIKIGRMFQESLSGTNQWRALPDIEDTANKFFEFFTKTQHERDKLGKEARESVEKYYNWDLIEEIWKNAIDNMPYIETWLEPPKLITPNMNIPANLNNEQFIEWCYKNIVHEPELLYSDIAQKSVAALNIGYETNYDSEGKPVKNPITRNIILKNMIDYVQYKNNIEQIRYERLVSQKNKNPFEIGVIEV